MLFSDVYITWTFLCVLSLGVYNQNTAGEIAIFILYTRNYLSNGKNNTATVTINHQYRKSHIGCRMLIGSIDKLGILKLNVRICTHFKAYLHNYLCNFKHNFRRNIGSYSVY